MYSNIQIADICHAANRAICESLPDPAIPTPATWDQASLGVQLGVIAGVKHFADNPGATPREAHAAWLMDKLRNGWKYGPVKDEATKRHPCIVDYDALPPHQKVKDAVFLAIVSTCLRINNQERAEIADGI